MNERTREALITALRIIAPILIIGGLIIADNPIVSLMVVLGLIMEIVVHGVEE